MMKLVNRLLVIAVIAFGSWFLVQQWDKVDLPAAVGTETEISMEEEIIEITDFGIETKAKEVKPKRDIHPVVETPIPSYKKQTSTPTAKSAPAVVTKVEVQETPIPVVSNIESEMTVYLFEGGFDVSKSTLPAGTITFHVRNDGKMNHEFAIEGVEDFGRIVPGEMKSFTLPLVEGEYELFSPKAVDQTLNMRETLRVENAE